MLMALQGLLLIFGAALALTVLQSWTINGPVFLGLVLIGLSILVDSIRRRHEERHQ